ncbi:hypothetical protein [Methylobacter sp. YRD-M1]|uniref:hypothetical protein n=1 Tax=Methylobacter sp. YRD-M1 TaxID=2911520 RepID=UPI00227BEC81|nr:hypothetical protein [Methylobacter sp. YRD-M1]WAK01864.1 hypothetical protein LZ558_18925 [Methylobacter sp. YRD-M1]
MAKTTIDEVIKTPVTTTKTVEEIIRQFDKEAAEDFKYRIRLNSISGDSSPELEKALTDRFPLLVINRTAEKTISFNLSNGKVIKI